MLNKKILIPLALLTTAIFAIGYGITTNYEPVSKFFYSSIADSLEDTTQTDMQVSGESKDVSQMFNERGFYKSNGVSFDENEIINDFNGNLMYEIPLYNFKHAGEMQYDVKLIYNGSVGHQVNIGNVNTWGGTTNDKHNMNSPEWILSLNGMAVQVFNFETNFFSNPPVNSTTIDGDYVHMLIPGYHFCNIMKSISAEKDRISLLAGDGSVITLVNKSTTSGASFSGVYHSEGKESYYWADVKFDPNDGGSPEWTRNRIIELTRGDGMVFEYKEYKRKYADFGLEESVGVKRPKIPLLIEIRDRFGYKIELGYEFTIAPGTMGIELVGRPLFVGASPNIGNLVNGSVSMLYSGNAAKIYNASTVNGNYKFDFDVPVYYTSGSNYGIANHKAYISKITNPLLQQSIVTYENNSNYSRKFELILNPVSGTTNTLKFNSIERIKSFTNSLGGKKEYSYYPQGVNELSINYLINNYNRTSYYKGYGREPFYSNMIYKKTDKFNATTSKSEIIFDFSYSDNGSHNDEEYPVDAEDTYFTTKITNSLNSGTINETPNQLKALREYRLYPVRFSDDNIAPENMQNYNGITKLIKEEFYEGTNNNTLAQKNEYTYQVLPQGGFQFKGSFLMISNKNTAKTIERLWTYEYGYKDSQLDSLVVWKKETDPNSNVTETNLYNLDTMLNFNIPGTSYNGQTETDQRRYYKIGLPTQQIKKNISNTIKFKTTKDYIFSVNDSRGYYGQLISEKTFAAPNFSGFIETKYEYYKIDNEGIGSYSGGTYPYKEGSLKRLIKPDNQEEKYFYNPVSNYEDEEYQDFDAPIRPNISYRVQYNNGTTTIQRSFWEDPRLPIRIDSYKRISSNSVDTLKRIYMQYNEAGMPVKIINENRYLTELKYQATHRISSITLPGDFSTSISYDSLYIEDNTFPVTWTVSANGWGNININDNNKAVFKDQSFWYAYPDYCDRFSMKFQTQLDLQKGSFFKMYLDLRNFTQIDSASFVMWHTYYNHKVNGVDPPISDYWTKLQPIDSLFSRIDDDDCGSENEYSVLGTRVNNYTQTIDVPTSYSTNCVPIKNVYDVKNLVTNLSQNNKNLFGLMIRPYFRYRDSPEGEGSEIDASSVIDFYLRHYNSTCNQYPTTTFMENYNEKITISGQYREYDTIVVPVVIGGTYIYRYDDVNNTVMTYSRLTHSPNKLKQVKYHLDGFGNIKEKDAYTSSSAFDDYNFAFNFMNQPAENIDARNNSTKLSYDNLGRQKKTLNADNTYSTIGYEYVNTIPEYFSGTYSGFLEKQTFTDETNRTFTKYFDAVGNLLREEKIVAAASGNSQIPAYEDQPYDPDTTYSGQDAPANWLTLRTDYKYDELYRQIEVKTPGGKSITYNYDSYGRQTKRVTPDAATTRYSYDNNDNLILVQDANQLSKSSSLNTRRTYDGLNRLLTISDYKLSGTPTETGPMGDTLLPFEFDTPPGIDSTYIINVYDTLTTSVADIFNSIKPSDYYSAPNYTKGNLVATSYRTVLGENWGYKFYRYDERGNITKLWHYLVGLGWKTEIYYHNSQSLLTRNWYQSGQSDNKLFTYGYDDAARLDYVNQYVGAQPEDPEEQGDYPTSYFTLTKYTYDENSQVDLHKLNNNTLTTNYNYNNRNWIFTTSQSGVSSTIFRYTLLYNANGNIRKQISHGNYSSNFSNNSDLWMTYIYDNSNRLLKADRDSGVTGSTHDLISGYDKDGNFVGMKRYGSSNNLEDEFGYSYFSGTNKLQTIGEGLTSYSYTYDNNGNMISDQLNRTSSIKYDHRNLMTDVRAVKTENGVFGPEDITYWTVYRYDEAGNRMRKIRYKYTGSEPDPVLDLTGDTPPWTLQSDEFYVRDISGKEITIYSGNSLTQWNIWGLDNIGKINADTTRNYYLKDHLGSIRVVLNSTNTVISAQDYDAWGYPLENRKYNSTAMKYGFTGKERDDETNYDYFGARYYDNRIANWMSTDPLFEKHFDFTPYNYVLRNPIAYIDPDGKQTWAIEGVLNVFGRTIEVVIPYAVIPGRLIGGIAPLIFTEQFGHAELKDMPQQSIYITGEYGYLEYPYPITNDVPITALQSEGDIVKLSDKQVKDYAKEQGYTGEKSVEKLKEQALKDKGISKEKARSFDVYKDKKTGEHFLKPKPKFEKQFKDKKIPIE